MITVRLPSGLRGSVDAGGRVGSEVRVDQPVATLGALITTLEHFRPDLRDALHDSLYNFAVNDTLILHGADAHPLRDGDIVELIPTIAGG